MAAAAHDRVTAAGIVLLVAVSGAGLWIYRARPQSAADARSRLSVVARPDHFGARLGRAEERLAAARAVEGSGQAAAAAPMLAEAATEAWEAQQLATSTSERAAAFAVWADATLLRADALRRGARAVWYRPDDRAALRRAVTLADSVRALAPGADARARADIVRAAAERQLRPRPLEWLPQRLPAR